MRDPVRNDVQPDHACGVSLSTSENDLSSSW